MGNKAPQPTAVLVKRLQRVAKCCDVEAARCETAAAGVVDGAVHVKNAAIWSARANTCWQATARLQELQAEVDRERAGNV